MQKEGLKKFSAGMLCGVVLATSALMSNVVYAAEMQDIASVEEVELSSSTEEMSPVEVQIDDVIEQTERESSEKYEEKVVWANENSELFMVRSTYPERTDVNARYYYDGNFNPFAASGYGMPNCTTYVWGRVYEVTGKRPNLSSGPAGDWYSYNKSNRAYGYGDVPKVGAIACYSGHVAFVEKIVGNTVWLSESAWSGHTNPNNRWFYREKTVSDKYSGTFYGYIYILIQIVLPLAFSRPPQQVM